MLCICYPSELSFFCCCPVLLSSEVISYKNLWSLILFSRDVFFPLSLRPCADLCCALFFLFGRSGPEDEEEEGVDFRFFSEANDTNLLRVDFCFSRTAKDCDTFDIDGREVSVTLITGASLVLVILRLRISSKNLTNDLLGLQATYFFGLKVEDMLFAYLNTIASLFQCSLSLSVRCCRFRC